LNGCTSGTPHPPYLGLPPELRVHSQDIGKKTGYCHTKKMKYHQTPHKKTKDKKSYITKIREEEQKKRDRLEKTNDKKNEDDSEKVDDNGQ